MSDEDNPVKIFFSAPNVRSLYQTIRQGLTESFGPKSLVGMDERFFSDLIEIMKMVMKPIKRVPADTDKDIFVQTLNKQVINEAVSMYVSVIQGDAPEVQQPSLERIPSPKPRQKKRQSTPIKSVTSSKEITDVALEHLMQNRNPEDVKPGVPKFKDDDEEYSDDINELYEHAEYYRQNQDLLPHPEIHDDSNVRETPLRYEATPPPRGAERYLEHKIESMAVPNRPSEMESSPIPLLPPQPSELQVLIPANSRNQVSETRAIPHIFVVNSTDRNPNIHPSPSEYRIVIRSPFIDVVSVKLLSADIPLSAYNVNSTNNLLYFEEVAGTTITAIIPEGNYPDADALAMAVEASMIAVTGLGVTYTATVDMLTGKITITSDGAGGAIFNLLFFGTPMLDGPGPAPFQKEIPQYPPASLGPILGYQAGVDYTGVLTYTAPFVPNMDGESSVYLHIKELELLKSENSNVDCSFAQIPYVGTDGYARYNCKQYAKFMRHFSPIEGKLAYLTISFRTASGELFDFNGRNNTLTFMIRTNDVNVGPYEPGNTDIPEQKH